MSLWPLCTKLPTSLTEALCWLTNGGKFVHSFALLSRAGSTFWHVLRQLLSGRDLWVNYYTFLQYTAAAPSEKVHEAMYAAVSFFLFHWAASPAFFHSPSNCLANNQSRVAEARRREMYSGGVVGNYTRNQFNEFPPSQKNLYKSGRWPLQTQTTTF